MSTFTDAVTKLYNFPQFISPIYLQPQLSKLQTLLKGDKSF